MKTKYAVITVIAVIGLAATLFAAEMQATSSKSKIILLKSGDKVVAELKILNMAQNSTFRVSRGELNTDKMTGNMTLKGSTFTIQFGESSNASITLKADEIQITNEP